jgi:hypothetical protein
MRQGEWAQHAFSPPPRDGMQVCMSESTPFALIVGRPTMLMTSPTFVIPAQKRCRDDEVFHSCDTAYLPLQTAFVANRLEFRMPGCSRKWDDLTDVGDAGNKLHQPLQPQSESGMRGRPKFPQFHIPLVVFG